MRNPYSDGLRATVKCYGADDVQEGVAIMHQRECWCFHHR